MGKCACDGCDRIAKCKGYCEKHYARIKHWGSPYIVKKMPNGTNASKHPLYSTWRSLADRCLTPTDKKYPLYGGRGIKICKRWRPPYGFWNFVKDMGDKPSYDRTVNGRALYSLDRIDVNGDYCPENCRWATQTEQMNNTRKNKKYTVHGVTGTFVEIARHFNVVPPHNADVRFYCYGWDIEKALFTPLKGKRKENYYR